MFIVNNNFNRVIILLIPIIILFFFSYHSKNFKLDASSDTLILQNDKDFKYFNYYNEIFPSKNFLVLAIKSNNIIDDLYLTKINEIKSILSKIKNVESTFAIVDAPILISNNVKLADLSSTNIPTINDNIIDLELIRYEAAMYHLDEGFLDTIKGTFRSAVDATKAIAQKAQELLQKFYEAVIEKFIEKIMTWAKKGLAFMMDILGYEIDGDVSLATPSW